MKTHGTPERSDDEVASYSSRGPTPYDLLIKPDLVAPGNKITSLEADGSYLSVTYPERRVASYETRNYFELSGTSMSAAVVSGAVALLLEANPDLTPGQVKVALQLTSSSVPEAGLIEAGAGSLDIVLALYLAEEGPTAPLPTASIADEPVTPTGLAFAMRASISPQHEFHPQGRFALGRGGPRLRVGGAAVGGAEARLHGGDAAEVGAAGAA